MHTEEFAYHLPQELIALAPRPRGRSRLLVLVRGGPTFEASVSDVPALLDPGDVLLVNDVRVLPARLVGRRSGGGTCQLLLVRAVSGGSWEVLGRPAAKLRPSMTILFPWGRGVVERQLGEGRLVVRFEPPLDLATLEQVGEIPLPPYIAKRRSTGPEDRRWYQTVYAQQGFAVAAPTAGLHFTREQLEACRKRGMEVASITLHVGPGTFKPVTAQDPRDHKLDPELYQVSPHTAWLLNRALAEGRRVVCVGTTSVRALEDALRRGHGRVYPGSYEAEAYILPGFAFQGTGALLTNFHLPRSTLVMLVAAFAGRERILHAYEMAKARGFRFYSYGDAMLIL
ncbi:MAG: tRNA preQ1(34) S-adenosylmethionine ribosyltransferase-isomerase QueA [Thermoanaerobaculum sp.]|nr:tRNA preQ1(34) S-adenosylmethionine ribosyltransferase-isomerase QueA [Thermoanaerobaculum sp.]